MTTTTHNFKSKIKLKIKRMQKIAKWTNRQLNMVLFPNLTLPSILLHLVTSCNFIVEEGEEGTFCRVQKRDVERLSYRGRLLQNPID